MTINSLFTIAFLVLALVVFAFVIFGSVYLIWISPAAQRRMQLRRRAAHDYGNARGTIHLKLLRNALDMSDLAVAFLHFWQVLEGIVSPKQKARDPEGKKLVQRLHLLTPLERSEKVTLVKMGDIRNELVHRSVFLNEDAEQQVRLIKPETDKFLLAILSRMSQLSEVIDLE